MQFMKKEIFILSLDHPSVALLFRLAVFSYHKLYAKSVLGHNSNYFTTYFDFPCYRLQHVPGFKTLHCYTIHTLKDVVVQQACQMVNMTELGGKQPGQC